jgi:unsaturated rhamnogalacturonyl hydrolase
MKLKLTITALLMYAGLTSNAQTVMLDYYFNHEVHKDATGQQVRFHYLWGEKKSPGFSIFGASFTTAGAKLDSLDQAPTAENLKNAAIYIIVDPDSRKESPKPNYIQPKDADEIAKWVKKGGVLLMMANDSANVELPHFNTLAAKFGMHFNDDLQNHVVDDAHFEDGAIKTTGNPVFKTANKIYMKDVCSISLTGPAIPVLKNSAGACIIASAKYGKGTVVAIGDPWLYNEYTNGRLPAGFENDKAANDVVQWLLQLVTGK